MRVVFRTTDHPKRVAKSVKKAAAARGFAISLGACQDLVARMFGYYDWHELHVVTLDSSDHSPRDEEVAPTVAEARRARQIDVLMKAGLPKATAVEIVDELKPSGCRKPI
jgi:hypothetical protein